MKTIKRPRHIHKLPNSFAVFWALFDPVLVHASLPNIYGRHANSVCPGYQTSAWLQHCLAGVMGYLELGKACNVLRLLALCSIGLGFPFFLFFLFLSCLLFLHTSGSSQHALQIEANKFALIDLWGGRARALPKLTKKWI